MTYSKAVQHDEIRELQLEELSQAAGGVIVDGNGGLANWTTTRDGWPDGSPNGSNM
jgi:hypothetical protein